MVSLWKVRLGPLIWLLELFMYKEIPCAGKKQQNPGGDGRFLSVLPSWARKDGYVILSLKSSKIPGTLL